MPSLPSWPTGPVCLIGDVAHATLPRAGQGASLAMEDAVGLADCLRDVPDRDANFAAFERLRKGRVEKLVEEARRNRDRKPYQRAHPRVPRPGAAVLPRDGHRERQKSLLLHRGLG